MPRLPSDSKMVVLTCMKALNHTPAPQHTSCCEASRQAMIGLSRQQPWRTSHLRSRPCTNRRPQTWHNGPVSLVSGDLGITSVVDRRPEPRLRQRRLWQRRSLPASRRLPGYDM